MKRLERGDSVAERMIQCHFKKSYDGRVQSIDQVSVCRPVVLY